MTTQSIDEAIRNTPTGREAFIPTRYPYTYACDYLRSNPQIIPVEVFEDPGLWTAQNSSLMSRADASRVRQRWAELTGMSDDTAAILLAGAYLTAAGIEVPNAVLAEALEVNANRLTSRGAA